MRIWFLLEQSIILAGHFIEEIVTINSQLVDDLLDHWFNCHEGVDTSTNLLVDQVLQMFRQLGHLYLASVALVEEGLQATCLIEGDGLAEASDDLVEFLSLDEPCLVGVEYLDDLPHLQLLLVDRISHNLQNVLVVLAIRCALLGLR